MYMIYVQPVRTNLLFQLQQASSSISPLRLVVGLSVAVSVVMVVLHEEVLV
jgi:hypothetical protein